jgi:site-specific DNA recombinase
MLVVTKRKQDRDPVDDGRKLRCAIYTRKSTEEGLEQAFNSLDAQFEACATYITSQRHEGWIQTKERYDDGGFSGGTMERPAMKRLLADVALGKVDVIIVYKVDSLTRALADFAMIVEILDARSASFVSVTQAFNTTTSMGRLTLNVLLSFAQFEREVTGERIRDKIAASKKKGMWMGGPVPLGYAVQDRILVIVPEEATIVRHIFTRYVELGSGAALIEDLHADGYRTKLRVHGDRQIGGVPFQRGMLFHILSNPIYIGKIAHHHDVHEGEHDGIINLELWTKVQDRIATNRVEQKGRRNAVHSSPLAGLLWTAMGGVCHLVMPSGGTDAIAITSPIAPSCIPTAQPAGVCPHPTSKQLSSSGYSRC